LCNTTKTVLSKTPYVVAKSAGSDLFQAFCYPLTPSGTAMLCVPAADTVSVIAPAQELIMHLFKLLVNDPFYSSAIKYHILSFSANNEYEYLLKRVKPGPSWKVHEIFI
jgi:hypothetical protein